MLRQKEKKENNPTLPDIVAMTLKRAYLDNLLGQ